MTRATSTILFSGFALLVAAAVPARSEDIVKARYEVTLGGTNVMKAEYNATLDGGQYQSKLTARSVGLTKLLSKYELSISAKGAVADADVRPASYNYARKKNKKLKERALTFGPDGNLDMQGADYGDAVYASLKDGVTDPLAMLLRLSRSGEPCKGKHRVFDGRDVFDISLSGAAKDKGSISCKLTYTPVAGGDVDDGDTDPQNYMVTLAPLGGAGGYIPVGISGRSKGVPFSVTATDVSYNGTPVDF